MMPEQQQHQLADISEDSQPPPQVSRANTTQLQYDPPPITPNRSHQPTRSSSVSRVSVEFFDPGGVQQLRRSMTLNPVEPNYVDFGSRHSSSSDLTIQEEDKFDLAKELRNVVQKREVHDVKARELGVGFRNLRVVGLGAESSFKSTLGSYLTPMTYIEGLRKYLHPPVRDILSGFEGVVRPGEMILVLGRPGSGCSTFLKALANRRSEYHAVEGEVYYDSISPSELQKHYRGDVQYCPEDDVHFPTLTVEQTIKFAATTRTPRDRPDETREIYAEQITDSLTTVFGLRHARKTPVGDHMLRGVSGGEKKRVSIAEALAARSCINAWDNSTRGLDSSTSLEFVQALRIATDTFRLTTIVSIYQAGEPLYKHFDKVCLISEGKMVYFGPADLARPYFIDMGYEPANRQTTPDFLVAVTDPTWRIQRPDAVNPPRTATEFADYFKKSDIGQRNRQEVEDYIEERVNKPERADAFKESARRELAKGTRKDSPFLLSIPKQIRAVMTRRAQILRGDKLPMYINLFSFVFQALIMGSLFLNMPLNTTAYFSRASILFFALLFSALNAMAEIPSLYAQRPIVFRHRHAALYHPFVESIALTLVDLPISFGILSLFSIVLYFMVGLQRSAEHFFVFFLFLFTMTVTMKGFFRAIAALFATDPMAQSVGGVFVLALNIYSGFTVPKPSMIGALRWITYINPFRYGFEALMSNEFRGLQGACETMVPQGPGYENVTIENQVCSAVGALPGQTTVDGSRFIFLSYTFTWSHTWMNFGILIAFAIGFLACLLLFTEYISSPSNVNSIVQFRRGKQRLATTKKDEESSRSEKQNTSTSSSSTERNALATQKPMIDVFSWQHLNYTVPIAGEEDRTLLNDVTGFVAPGKLTALMGESGAGKTTLLNVLAERTTTGVVRGDRFVNGQPLPRDFQAQTAYCQQMDTHVPECTVREALLFSAKLRQPTSVPLAEKEAYVEQCLKMCGLEEYAEATIGSLGVEHRKRTTIGVELAAKPKLLLFLDEPTSGLDSQSAWAIVSFLRALADNGQAILCTIHQPSAELFQVFDRLLLLRKGGHTVYFGDLGHHATTLINYFERNGARSCEPDENPAEYMLEAIGAGATASKKYDWATIWRNSPEFVNVQTEVNAIHAEGRNRPPVETTLATEFATPWLYQTMELVRRGNVAFWRNPTYLLAKLSLNIIGGLFIGFTFFKASDTQQATQNKLFAIFMATILSVPLSNQLQVPYISLRAIYEVRERPSRIYSWTAFTTAHLLVELPWNFLGSVLLFFCWYWPVGFPADRAGYTFLMITIVYPLYYTTIALVVAAATPSAEIAAIVFSVLFSFVIVFNGVIQPFGQLGWWRWMYRLSPFTYLVEGLLGQALGGQSVHCSAVETIQLTPPAGLTCGQYLERFISTSGGYLTNPNATDSCDFCSVSSVDDLLASGYNIFPENAWRDFGLMWAYIIFNIVVIYIFVYLFRIRTGSLLPSFGKKKKA